MLLPISPCAGATGAGTVEAELDTLSVCAGATAVSEAFLGASATAGVDATMGGVAGVDL
jgi:hypothetical protein